jgi:predicted membrane channel-forming protein YqfA (hemolysin III family)
MRSQRWIGVLFAIGSACFVAGPFPGFVQLVGSGADGVVFFVGSIFFTSAAALQLLTTPRDARGDWWAGAIQLAGTLFFNLSTFDATRDALDTTAENRLVWAPDAFGSICFLVASAIAFAVVRNKRGTRDRRIAVVNLAGSVAFGVSAVASYIVPAKGSELDLAAANVTTVLGALCFLTGALMLMRSPESPA